MKKTLFFLVLILLTGCSSQHKLNRSIKKAQRMTMNDFKNGKIKVEYPNLNP
jgi:uncharacterized protein YcfL